MQSLLQAGVIEKTTSHEQLEDLLDAIHNLPKAIRNWEKQGPAHLREKLRDYDDKWKGKGGLVLGEVWDEALREGAERQ